MPFEINLAVTFLIASGIVFYAGYGTSLWLTTKNLQTHFYLLVPFVGLFLVDAISHYGHCANLAGRQTIWVLLTISSLINLSAIIWRRHSFRCTPQWWTGHSGDILVVEDQTR